MVSVNTGQIPTTGCESIPADVNQAGDIKESVPSNGSRGDLGLL